MSAIASVLIHSVPFLFNFLLHLIQISVVSVMGVISDTADIPICCDMKEFVTTHSSKMLKQVKTKHPDLVYVMCGMTTPGSGCLSKVTNDLGSSVILKLACQRLLQSIQNEEVFKCFDPLRLP